MTAILILLAVLLLCWLGPIGLLVLLASVLTGLLLLADWVWQFATQGWFLFLLLIPLAMLIYYAQRDLGGPPFGRLR